MAKRMTRLEAGEEINNIANKINSLAEQLEKGNVLRLELEIAMQCMKLQRVAEKLGVFFIDD